MKKETRGRKSGINEKMVAEAIKRKILRGERIRKGEIAVDNGYSPKSARGGKPYNNKSFKEEEKGILQLMQEERMRIARAMAKKDLDKEQYKVLAEAQDKVNKNALLLGGEATENIEYRIIE